MPNPTTSDLHVNTPLTNVSVAYIQSADAFIATKVFPIVKVKHQSDLYWKYSKSDWRKTDVQERAPSTESAGTGWNTTTDQYFCKKYAVHKDIDDDLRANSDSVFNLDRDATEMITNQHLLARDIAWTNSYMQTGVWATEYTGVDASPTGTDFLQWDQPSSDPIRDVSLWTIAFRKLTGFAFNICVMGAYVMVALKQHPDIIDRIKYTQRGIVTEDLIATLFDIDELYVTYATVNTGPEIDDAVQQDAVADYEFISNAFSVLFVYAPKSPSTLTPSAGYTFVWNGLFGQSGEGIRIKRFRMEHLESDRIEAETTYSHKVVCSDMGIFLDSVVAEVG